MFEGLLATAVDMTDAELRRCAHPGWAVTPRHADVDHEWLDGGRTDQSDAAVECRTHIRWKRRHRWRTITDLHARRFTVRPDGTILLPAGARPPDIPTDGQRLLRMDQLTRRAACATARTATDGTFRSAFRRRGPRST